MEQEVLSPFTFASETPTIIMTVVASCELPSLFSTELHKPWMGGWTDKWTEGKVLPFVIRQEMIVYP